jgi:uncharacterized membrane protein
MSRLTRSLIAALATLAVAACDDSTGITAEEIACPTTPTLTYASFGQRVIEENCNSCHATRERPHLTTPAQVQAEAQDIIQEAVFHSAMPEGADMTRELRVQLGQWLSCGAP